MNDDKNPSPGEPAGQQPTEQFGQVGDSSGEGAAGQPGAAAEAARQGQAVPPAEQTSPLSQPGPSAEQHSGQAGPAAEQTSQSGQPGPTAEQAGQAAPTGEPAGQQSNQPGHFAQPGPWGMPLPPPKQSGFRRFVAHRATQLVAVGVLGLAVGGGIVGGVMAATHHPGRPGMSQHQGGHRFNDGGPGPRHRVPDGQNGGNQNNGPGFGNGGGTSSGTGS
ncbi:hypothetical protein L3Q65_37140 [Amycolatopsis sp. FU40]|uniref:hypothetical protein n=1 Tax=Amycolatopsis sp. FU40 TaxID=2914159 RepID=UPI001F28A9CB|nr:hypothetical protein [Amycolatopsis sp. FU40]UKD53478.1 hypothetical protein L3Q65_37140 [Amycolatopsis sp. FU40]